MYDVAHIFLCWLVYKFCVSDMWKQIFCASQVLVWCDQNFATLPEGKFSFVFWLLIKFVSNSMYIFLYIFLKS